MEELISRYGQKRNVTDNGHGIFTVEGESRFFRAGMNENNTDIDYVDPEGGPFFSVGSDYGFGKISKIFIEKHEKKGYFKVRFEVET